MPRRFSILRPLTPPFFAANRPQNGHAGAKVVILLQRNDVASQVVGADLVDRFLVAEELNEAVEHGFVLAMGIWFLERLDLRQVFCARRRAELALSASHLPVRIPEHRPLLACADPFQTPLREPTPAEAATKGFQRCRRENTRYMDAALNQLRSEGVEVKDEDAARLSPLGDKHINVQGRYHFTITDAVLKGELRPLHNPDETELLLRETP